VKVSWLRTAEELAALAPAWDELAEAEGIPFVRYAWFHAWWEAFGEGSRAVAVAHDGDRLTGVFPLQQHGATLAALANDHSPLYRPFGTEAGIAAVADAALGEAGSLTVPMLDEAHPAFAILRERAAAAGRLVVAQRLQRQPVVELAGSYEDYVRTRDRKYWKDVERRRRKLEAEVSPDELALAPPDDLDRQLTLGFRAEASGWKGERGSAIVDDPRAERFYRDLARAFGDRFRLSALATDGDYAAFDYCILDHGRVWILKGGYDERFRRYAPGLVLTVAEIRRACELGCDAVELLGESVPWKLRFADAGRSVAFLGAYARRPAPLARYAYRRARPALRAAYRRLPGRGVR
jgi:CelD/BcsL family acetyltransferase involved in cellulose biosynthesis